jgi:hypothetical protein
MAGWIRTELDSRAFSFAREYLSNCGALARQLAAEISEDEYSAAAYLPDGCPRSRRYEFSRGGLHLLEETDGQTRLGSARDTLVEDLCDWFESRVNGLFVTEVVLARPDDPWVERGQASLPVSRFGDSDVYFYATAPLTAEELHTLIGRAEASPWTFGVVSSWSGSSARFPSRLESSDLAKIVSTTSCFYLGAYDLESYILYTRRCG